MFEYPICVGIDPGNKGAIARYDPIVDTIDIHDIPLTNVAKTKVKMGVDECAISNLLRSFIIPDRKVHVFIERVGALSGEGAQGAFSFGVGYGVLRGAAAALLLPIETIEAQTWKRRLGVPAEKNASRRRASELLPKHGHLWPLVKHDGRAEASMIAVYGAHLLSARMAA